MTTSTPLSSKKARLVQALPGEPANNSNRNLL